MGPHPSATSSRPASIRPIRQPTARTTEDEDTRPSRRHHSGGLGRSLPRPPLVVGAVALAAIVGAGMLGWAVVAKDTIWARPQTAPEVPVTAMNLIAERAHNSPVVLADPSDERFVPRWGSSSPNSPGFRRGCRGPGPPQRRCLEQHMGLPVSLTVRTDPSRNSRSYFLGISGCSLLIDHAPRTGNAQVELVGSCFP